MRERGSAIHVDCPACGVAAETGQASYWPASGEMTCRTCLFTIAAPGVIGCRGHDVPPEPIRALADWDDLVTDATESCRPASQRRWVLRLVPREEEAARRRPPLGPLEALARDPSLSSITIRLNRHGGAR